MFVYNVQKRTAVVSMPLKVFVVFHETLNPGCYSALDADEFETITFVAVRPDVPKNYDATRFTRVVNAPGPWVL